MRKFKKDLHFVRLCGKISHLCPDSRSSMNVKWKGSKIQLWNIVCPFKTFAIWETRLYKTAAWLRRKRLRRISRTGTCVNIVASLLEMLALVPSVLQSSRSFIGRRRMEKVKKEHVQGRMRRKSLKRVLRASLFWVSSVGLKSQSLSLRGSLSQKFTWPLGAREFFFHMNVVIWSVLRCCGLVGKAAGGIWLLWK